MKKNLPDRYFYPAVFIYEDGQEIAVDFPDLGVATSGTSEDDALLSARELLGCVMCGLEEEASAPSCLKSIAFQAAPPRGCFLFCPATTGSGDRSASWANMARKKRPCPDGQRRLRDLVVTVLSFVDRTPETDFRGFIPAAQRLFSQSRSS